MKLIIKENKTMTTINYKDIMNLGFPKHTARSIIKQAKIQLVNRGLTLYANNRIGTVPREIVEEILGIQFPIKKEGI
jgi:hypothetical protein